MHKPRRRAVLISVIAVAALALGATPALATGWVPDVEPVDSREPTSLEETAAPQDEEKLTLPPASTAMLEEATAIEAKFADHEQFNTVEINPDRTRLIVWWHGAADAELQLFLDRQSVPVSVEQTQFLPGEIKAAAKTLVDQFETTDVTSSYVTKEGDRIKVTLGSSSDTGSKQSRAESELTSKAGYPVEIEVGAGIAPASLARQYDTFVLGGAKITNYAAGNG